jgi:mRNA-degrading endonuclease RelE of RelBE toxin-antitoxin system
MRVMFPYNVGMANVEITPEAASDLARLRNPILNRVHRLLAKLEDWPAVSGVKPLSGNLAGHYRLRTGDYRVQFHVAGDLVTVEKIGHRDGFYEE